MRRFATVRAALLGAEVLDRWLREEGPGSPDGGQGFQRHLARATAEQRANREGADDVHLVWQLQLRGTAG